MVQQAPVTKDDPMYRLLRDGKIDEFLRQMRRHAHLRAVVFGHIHQHWDSLEGQLRLLGTPSTCIQFRPLSEDFGIDEQDPGYRIIQLRTHDFTTEIVRCPMQVKKVISGGQTGVDRAALDSAIQLAIPHGGWCPRGRRALDGQIDGVYQLQETPSSAYPQRTEWNIRDADATLILSRGEPDGGTALTVKLAREMEKPLMIIDLNQPAPIKDTVNWLRNHRVETLNIAGPRQAEARPIYAPARHYITRILSTAT